MKEYTKFIGVALATIMAFGFVACDKGSNVKLSCDSDEIIKAFEKHRHIADLKALYKNAKFSDFHHQSMGTAGADMESDENVLYCQCTMEYSVKSRTTNQTLFLFFTAERFKSGEIALYDWNLY